ncbi:SagB/ThcOx family dehydrogenase [Virgibacillus proomii]|uniref:SagB/ThcOx family dehydrogenase n=1 Tax=Virgibacillus proomii TaxID=84407 RepID=UPI001C126DA5|nr:SagB/ThcOx family dehydrogenase [Virgibacillus proomii]MBU5267382.1 SagB/ThcOx family dehydrogenase [Virgibacillus proomii]
MQLRRYRLAPDLVITFPEGQPKLHLPSTHTTYKVDWKVCEVISMFSSEDPDTYTYKFSPPLSDSLIHSIVNKLIECNILIEKDKETEADSIVKKWEDWDESSWFMHLQTKDAEFDPTEEGRLESVKMFRKIATSPPSYYKCECSEERQIKLPAPSKLYERSLSEAFLERRTCRRFSGEAITLQDLADVLFYTGGILFTNATHSYGTVAKKASPSPGARHSTELYPAVNNCEGLESGIYHYCQKHHALHLITKDIDVKEFLSDALYDQDYFLDAAVTILYTSVVDRLKWKYKASRVYRLMHFETGHYAQNFVLTGSALNLGVFITAAFKDSLVESVLGIDGIYETAMYVTGIGSKLPDRELRGDIEFSEFIPEDKKIGLPIGEHS